jgi:sugar lactone lactonase YvrE
MGWLPDGTLLVVSMLDRVILRGDQGSLSVFADLSSAFPYPANDMLVTGTGDAWVGSLGFDMAAGADPRPSDLLHVSVEGTVTRVADDLMVPNGCAMLPDTSTLVVAETLRSRLTAFTVTESGELTHRRVWAQLAEPPAIGTSRESFGALRSGPDGIAADAEGCVWVADPVRGECRRIAEGGTVLETIRAPRGQSVFACWLGGPSGHDLLMCCSPDASERRRTAARDSALVCRRVKVPA